jgi:hypothetical protein
MYLRVLFLFFLAFFSLNLEVRADEWSEERAREYYWNYENNWFRDLTDLNKKILGQCWEEGGKRCYRLELKETCLKYCYCITEGFLREFESLKDYEEINEEIKEGRMFRIIQNCSVKIFGRDLYNFKYGKI